MHTATRLFLRVVDRVRAANPRAHLCAYGLYAPLNERLLRQRGRCRPSSAANSNSRWWTCARRLEAAEAAGPHRRPAAADLDWPPAVSGARPHRPAAARRLRPTGGRMAPPGRVGYTEASARLQASLPPLPRGAGVWRPVPHRAARRWCWKISAARWPPAREHITFGDPDFFNGPGHAIAIVEALHREWPELTYDVTIKVEHLLQHRDLLPVLKAHRLPVRHQRGGIARRCGAREAGQGPHARRISEKRCSSMRAAGLPLAPTFIPFTPWTTLRELPRIPARAAGSRSGGPDRARSNWPSAC